MYGRSRVNVKVEPRSTFTWPFIHCLYFTYARKFDVRSKGKITRQWKSTFKLNSVKFYVGMSWTVYARAQPELSIIISLAPYRSNVYIL